MEIGEQTGWEESQPKLSTYENATGKSLLCKPIKERKKKRKNEDLEIKVSG